MVEKDKKDEGKVLGRDYPEWYLSPEEFAKKYPTDAGQAIEQSKLNVPIQPGLFNGNGLSPRDKLLQKYDPEKAKTIYRKCLQRGISRERLTSSAQERYDLGRLLSEEVQAHKREIFDIDEKPFWIPEFKPRRRKKKRLESKVSSDEDFDSRPIPPENSYSTLEKIKSELLSGKKLRITASLEARQYQDRGQSFEVPVRYSINGFPEFYSCVLKGFDRDASDLEVKKDSLDNLKRILSSPRLELVLEENERGDFIVKKNS